MSGRHKRLAEALFIGPKALACFAIFARLRRHRAAQHVGKVPQRAQALWQRRQLEARLADAVKAQRYEEAIALRDELRRLPETDAAKGGPP